MASKNKEKRENLASTEEVLAALSQALDMVEGQPRGHSFRTGRIAVNICQILGCSEKTISNAYFASLLKDSGCSNNSSIVHQILGGDDISNKRDIRLIDWSRPLEAIKFGLTHFENGEPFQKKLLKLTKLLGKSFGLKKEVTEARCTRGAMIALSLGFDFEVGCAIQNLDEHWDGRGTPGMRKKEEIPFLSRVICLAQTLEIFSAAYGIDQAFEVLAERSGKWFDPEVSTAAKYLQANDEFWKAHFQRIDGNTQIYNDLPKLPKYTATDIDTVCEVFAAIVDAKSPYTAKHSTRVTEYAVKLGEHFSFDSERLQTLRRASLLHDVGKLAVSNSILDKPGKLTPEEFDQIKLHPKNSYLILSQIQGLERITEIASAHHERLDGKGYWQGLGASQLDLDMRILTASDVFDALSAKRPYRDALPTTEVFRIMEKDIDTAFDPACVDALQQIYGMKEFLVTPQSEAA